MSVTSTLSMRSSNTLTLGLFHEVALLLATSSALWMVLVGGLLVPAAWLCVLAPIVSIFLAMKKRSVPVSSGRILGAASLALGAAQIVAGGLSYVVIGACTAVMGLLVARLLTRRSLDHDLQALVLALVLVVAGSVLNLTLWFAVWFVLFAVFATWCLTTRQLLLAAQETRGEEDARRRTDIVTPTFFGATAAVTLVVLAVTIVVFALFPRVGFLRFALSPQQSGRFPGEVSLASGPRATFNQGGVVARVAGIPEQAFMDGLYLRGGVYEVVDGRGFRRLEPPPPADARSLRLATGPVSARYRIQLSPFAGKLIFSLGSVSSATSVRGGNANPNVRVDVRGEDARTQLLASQALGAPFTYEIAGTISAPGYIPDDDKNRPPPEELFSALPLELHDRLAPLAAKWVKGADDPSVIAARIHDGLLDEYTYTLDFDASGDGDRALETFLFDTKRGHCEFFATAFAALLRTQGIPSRVVGGYQGGSWDDESGQVLFYGANAHAWTEWRHPVAGWIVDDATPAASAPRSRLGALAQFSERLRKWWDDRVVDFSFADQVQGLRGLSDLLRGISSERVLAAVFGASALVGAGFVSRWWWMRRRRRQQGRHPLAERLLAFFALCTGRPLDPALTFQEAFFGAEAFGFDGETERQAVKRAIDAYEAERFGGVPASDDLITVIDGLLKARRKRR